MANGGVYESAEQATKYLVLRTKHRPTIGIICGSGLGGLADNVEDMDQFNFSDIPGFPLSTVAGHAGKLVFGQLGGKCVVLMQGRFHGYEGHSQYKITFPVRVMALLGIKKLIVTNAAGALNPGYNVGDVMIIKDHINLPGMCGVNPLVGLNDERFGTRFPAMSAAYNKELQDLASNVATGLGYESFIRSGVYAMQMGPFYGTPAESRMLAAMGADVVGMSTVPEVMVAVHCGIQVCALSLVTDKAVMDDDTGKLTNHEEVLEVARRRSGDIMKLVENMLWKM